MFVLQSADFQRLLRRERDSNPRRCYPQRFSRPPQSTTLPSLRGIALSAQTTFVEKSGEDEIRTRGRKISYDSLANCWFQPLTHLSSATADFSISACKVTRISRFCKILKDFFRHSLFCRLDFCMIPLFRQPQSLHAPLLSTIGKAGFPAGKGADKRTPFHTPHSHRHFLFVYKIYCASIFCISTTLESVPNFCSNGSAFPLIQIFISASVSNVPAVSTENRSTERYGIDM